MIFNVTSGGGGGLNFKMVGGNAQPEEPKENTIWVNTATEITSWAFSATEPEAPVDGMVWITTGTSSIIEFNALKKNGIQVYPISAKQYISGAWIPITATIYQNGEWVAWIVYLYNNGTLRSPLTSAVTKMLNSTTVKFNSDNITYYDTNNAGNVGGFAFDNKIDVSNFKTLRAKCRVSFATTATAKYKFGISKAKSTSTSNMVAVASIPYSTNAVYVDVPIAEYSGEYYLVFSCGGISLESQYVEIEEIILM